MNGKNRTGGQYFKMEDRELPPSVIWETAVDAPGEEMARQIDFSSAAKGGSLIQNYLFCAVAGVTWYFQFFFYTMGESQMGQYKFSSWTLHMASIIIFSTLWGLALREWKGASRRAFGFLTLSLAMLVASTVIIGYSNYLSSINPH